VKPLSPAHLLFLHAQLATTLGKSRGVADVEVLRAALASVESLPDGADLFEIAAALAGALARARPFHAANLAVAAAAAGLFLREYDLDLRLDAPSAPDLVALLSADDPDSLIAWLRQRTLPLALE
jgi:prophage maintenance system killer protein